MRRRVRRLWLASSLLMAVAAADVAVLLVLGSHVPMARWVPVSDLGGVRTAYERADDSALAPTSSAPIHSCSCGAS